METIKGMNLGDNMDGEDEVQNKVEDKITLYVSTGTLDSYLRNN